MPARALLGRAFAHSAAYLESLPSRPVGPRATAAQLREALDRELPAEPQAEVDVLDDLVRQVEPGVVASAGPRFFGFVVGGSLPVALAADWLTSAWDQNAQAFALSPAAAIVEEVVGRWLLELLGLPEGASVGFVTGAQMATFVGLAAARHELLRREGWDVEARGLFGAPPIDLVIGSAAHGTILTALRMLGLGAQRVRRVETDSDGRMLVGSLDGVLAACGASTIVCAQAGNVNTGAFDPIDAIADSVGRRGGWLHIDGAFGLWAAASPALRARTAGIARADSWAVDGHKWLNVPQDSGIAIVAHPAAHEAAMAGECAYVEAAAGQRDGMRFVPENSRRARGLVLYAALRALGRRGVAELVERCCGHARRMADRLSCCPGVRVLNEVCLNQVLVGFADEALTVGVARRLQSEGTCWMGTTKWRGASALRISICNWSTTADDIDRSADAIVAALRAELGLRGVSPGA